MTGIAPLLLLLALLNGPNDLVMASEGNDSAFTVLYSNSVNGETDPCG